MQQAEPRNLRGLVQTKDLADYVGVPEATIRVWRKRHSDWVARGRPVSKALPSQFPEPVSDPQEPAGAPFMVNSAPVYDVADVMRFGAYLRQHERKAGNPTWLLPAGQRHSFG
ncbi:hypothetical protein ASH00_14685 [Arthrobacter sp. Soil782]|uniref:hypothetical protein n=1 Tax=Arthrobacter sp. Soil782 TaxID=1736410 RepID=UPI0006FD72C7|nr:hypothetical protein [Arthrobacter sp. Soil782]KRF04347.1 hypothetical protein ASH00_14685 [Arthrobacter sp. Soil782]